MLRTSVQPKSLKSPASKSLHKLLEAVQAFWKFSLYYGEFVSTPIQERKIRDCSRTK
jgi:hypothetical protein